jgi:hypothetical protein
MNADNNQNQFNDLFDHMIPGGTPEHAPQNQAAETDEVKEFTDKLTQGDMVTTSYFMVNALFNLLVQKGYIKEAEVNRLIEELYGEFKQKRGRRT